MEPEEPNYLAAFVVNIRLAGKVSTAAVTPLTNSGTASGTTTQGYHISVSLTPDFSFMEQVENIAEFQIPPPATPTRQMEIKPQPKPVEYLATDPAQKGQSDTSS